MRLRTEAAVLGHRGPNSSWASSSSRPMASAKGGDDDLFEQPLDQLVAARRRCRPGAAPDRGWSRRCRAGSCTWRSSGRSCRRRCRCRRCAVLGGVLSSSSSSLRRAPRPPGRRMAHAAATPSGGHRAPSRRPPVRLTSPAGAGFFGSRGRGPTSRTTAAGPGRASAVRSRCRSDGRRWPRRC